MRQHQIGRRNPWKWAFLLLLASFVGLTAVLLHRVQTPRENSRQIAQQSLKNDLKIGTFTTNRQQLNETIQTYLRDYQTEQFSYKVYATNQLVLFEGSYELLGSKIPLYLYFQPSKLEDGSVLLQVTEISAGTLSLPRGEVLGYLKKNYKLPNFVTVDVERSSLRLNLPTINNTVGIYVKVNTIDLYNDQLIFDIYRKK